jgi:hypothetical protein
VQLLVATHAPGCVGNCVTGNAIFESVDNGRTWSAARDISASIGPARASRTGPGVALLLMAGPRAGRLLAPASIGTYTADYVLSSDDTGGTWRAVGGTNFSGMDEAQLTQVANGSVLMLMRHVAEPWMGKAAAWSHDGGETWSNVSYPWARGTASYLMGPVCQASVTSFGGASYFSGPNSSNHNREHLVVRSSSDSAGTWDGGVTIDVGFSAYSCLVSAPLSRGPCPAGPGGCGGVLYEGGGGLLRFVRFPLASALG